MCLFSRCLPSLCLPCHVCLHPYFVHCLFGPYLALILVLKLYLDPVLGFDLVPGYRFCFPFLRLVFREPAYLQCGFTAPENHEQNFCSVICCLRAASRSKYTGRDISVEAALAACGLHKGPTLMPNNQAPASPGRACRRMCWGSASCWASWVPLGPLPPWSAFY